MNHQEEVSLRDVIKRMRQIIRFLLSKWLIIVIVGISGGALGLLYAYLAAPSYTAKLNFVLSTNSDNQTFMGLASQFGINLGTGSNDLFSGDNIITLMKSRRMVQQTLFAKPPGSDESLINSFVRMNKIDKSWQEKERTKNVYPFPDSPGKMTMVQDSLSRAICYSVANDLLDVSKPYKDQDIYNLATTYKDADFAYYLTKYLVDATSKFYIKTKTSSAKENLDMLLKEADSLRRVLGGAITSAGSQTDFTFNLNPAYQVQRSGAQESQALAGALGQAYGQVLQNLEIAKITLQKETPLYQIIDEPTLPLETDKPRKLYSIVIGGFLAGFLVCGILVGRKAYKSYV
jgi:capsule polysaccharide export protein KpsE/RkpR